MADCIFCKIVAREIPAGVVFEDDVCVAFLDINPVRPGHTLVIPKAHHAQLVSTPDDVLGHVMLVCKKLIPILTAALEDDFVNLGVQGTDVPHFHVHLIPRRYDDGLAGFWPSTQYQNGQADEVLKKITAKLTA